MQNLSGHWFACLKGMFSQISMICEGYIFFPHYLFWLFWQIFASQTGMWLYTAVLVIANSGWRVKGKPLFDTCRWWVSVAGQSTCFVHVIPLPVHPSLYRCSGQPESQVQWQGHSLCWLLTCDHGHIYWNIGGVKCLLNIQQCQFAMTCNSTWVGDIISFH